MHARTPACNPCAYIMWFTPLGKGGAVAACRSTRKSADTSERRGACVLRSGFHHVVRLAVAVVDAVIAHL
jgi:hypothetical protein